MASRLWTFVTNMVAGATARVEHINTKFGEIDAALLAAANELNRTIRFTAGTVPAESKFQVAQTDLQRANLGLAFDSAGNVQLRAFTFTWRADWVQPTNYSANDVVRAPESHGRSLYIAASSHTSTSSFTADLAAGRWLLMVDLTQVDKAAKKFKIITNTESPYQAVSGDDLFVDTTVGPVTITLPALPTILDQPITVAHFLGSASSNPITVGRNGKLIMALALDRTISVNNTVEVYAFSNETGGWRLL